MKRLEFLMLAVIIALVLCACGAAGAGAAEQTPAAAATDGAEPTEAPAAEDTPAPTEPPAPMTLDLPAPADGWADSYIAFLDDNYDILAALWPEGLTGVGFIDLDLDGTPEMILFDLGASATLGAQMFDVVDGQVYCVSSVQENAAGAFGGEHFSRVSVCTSFFEAFRLSATDNGYCFWVDSANGTLESSWDELVRFDCTDGVLTPVSVCGRYLESDGETGAVVAERYTVAGEESDSDSFTEAFKTYSEARDTGYGAVGVFLWSDIQRYDTTYDGLMAMARDAVDAYVPIDVS